MGKEFWAHKWRCLREAFQGKLAIAGLGAIICAPTAVIYKPWEGVMNWLPSAIFFIAFLVAIGVGISRSSYRAYKEIENDRDSLKNQIDGMLSPMPDVWLYDAMVYVAERQWGGEIDCTRGEQFIHAVFRTLDDIHQKAADNYLPIWGRPNGYKSGALAKIDKKYWIHYGFNQMSFYLPEKVQYKTEPKSPGIRTGNVLWNLKTLRSTVEALWPPEYT